MTRNEDTSARDSPIRAYDDQGNPLNSDDTRREESDQLGLDQEPDAEQM